MRLHAFPLIGSGPLDSFRPRRVRELLGALEASSISSSYARTIYSDVRAVLSARPPAAGEGRGPLLPRTAGGARPDDGRSAARW
ncbi:hypothetical protein ACF05T_25620 [Streptomyces lateritius]|uniref:Uncharacterized protein n=1 Tax=Streptomyces lateritius TaxID=67313 RepID=A0ABW6YIQ8_9ACTN